MTLLRVTEVDVAEGAQGTRCKQRKGVSRNLWSDRLSLKSDCGLRVSRPLCAVRRRLLGVSEAVGHVAEVEFVERRTVLWGLGRANNQGAQGVVSALLGS